MLLGYIRVSTDKQVDGTSPAEQERVIRAYAMLHNLQNYDVVIYRDDAVSGSIPLRDRPAGKKLLAAAQSGDVIVAAKLDRCFRDALDALEMFNWCKERKIDLVLYDLGHTSVLKDGISKLMFMIVTAFAEMERSRIRERVLGGKAAKKARGGHLGGDAPYGYRVVGEGKESRLEEVPEEQATVSEIKRVWKESDSLAETARKITEMGITTRQGTPMRKMQILRIARRQ